MAEEFVSPIDMLLDENNNDNIKLFNENNEEIEFEQIALVPVDGKTYAILKPAADMEGVADDEALVFAIDEVDGEECLVIVEDDSVIDKVFADYYEMLKSTISSSLGEMIQTRRFRSIPKIKWSTTRPPR